MNAFTFARRESSYHSHFFIRSFYICQTIYDLQGCVQTNQKFMGFKDVIFLRFSSRQRICVRFFPVPRIIAHQRLTFYHVHFNCWQHILKGFQRLQAKDIFVREMKVEILSLMKFQLSIRNHYLTFQHRTENL